MSEERKKREIEHYDKTAVEPAKILRHHRDFTKQIGSSFKERCIPLNPSLQRTYHLLNKYVKDKRVLDYCCGHGVHTLSILRMEAQNVVGIDLSEKSLDRARELIKTEQAFTGKNNESGDSSQRSRSVNFLKMDAESLKFEDESFDVVFDGGSFSSLDLHQAVREINRVLKPGGILIGIETLGHNPIMNIKRWFNVKRGTRTKWASDHIFKLEDFKLLDKYFNSIHREFLELASLLGQSVNNTTLMKLGAKFDSILLKSPHFQPWAFKTLFVYQKP